MAFAQKYAPACAGDAFCLLLEGQCLVLLEDREVWGGARTAACALVRVGFGITTASLAGRTPTPACTCAAQVRVRLAVGELLKVLAQRRGTAVYERTCQTVLSSIHANFVRPAQHSTA